MAAAPTEDHDPDQGARAYDHYCRTLYEAHRGLMTAYAVDTGHRDPGEGLPSWGELGPVRQNAWRRAVLETRPVFAAGVAALHLLGRG